MTGAALSRADNAACRLAVAAARTEEQSGRPGPAGGRVRSLYGSDGGGGSVVSQGHRTDAGGSDPLPGRRYLLGRHGPGEGPRGTGRDVTLHHAVWREGETCLRTSRSRRGHARVTYRHSRMPGEETQTDGSGL